MFDISAFLERYPQLRPHAVEVVAVFRALVDLRLRILEFEDEAFDDHRTQGYRFFVGSVRLALSEGRPPGLGIIDPERGVLSLCDLLFFKVYRPRLSGRPSANTTRVSELERDAIQQSLFPEEAKASLQHNLLRMTVDADGEPLSLRWEVWDQGALSWSTEIFMASSRPRLHAVTADLPVPAAPPSFSVGLLQDIAETDDDIDTDE
jgi:hypothetical protein